MDIGLLLGFHTAVNCRSLLNQRLAEVLVERNFVCYAYFTTIIGDPTATKHYKMRYTHCYRNCYNKLIQRIHY